MHLKNYNYLNPTRLLDLCCSVLQLISLDCGSILVVGHDKNFCFISELDRKDFVDCFVDILCAFNTGAYLEPRRASTIKLFAKIVNRF